MRLLILGYGSIGKKHAGLLTRAGHELIIADPGIEGTALPPGMEYLTSGADLACAKAHGAIIATPNHLHAELLSSVLSLNIPVLVEKPLLHLWPEQVLCALIEASDQRILVGCNLQFRPEFACIESVLQAGVLGRIHHARAICASYLPGWRPGDYRTYYSAKPEQGGGILLDAIHELNYLRQLFGKVHTVLCQAGTISNLDLQVEDTADLLLRFSAGTWANVHLSYARHRYTRTLELSGEHGTLEWDFAAKRVTIHRGAGPSEVQDFSTYADLTMYERELAHFCRIIEGCEVPRTSGLQGLEDLRLVLAAKESALSRRTIDLDTLPIKEGL